MKFSRDTAPALSKIVSQNENIAKKNQFVIDNFEKKRRTAVGKAFVVERRVTVAVLDSVAEHGHLVDVQVGRVV